MGARVTMTPTVEQMAAAAALAANPGTDPVVLAAALGMVLAGRGMLTEAYMMARMADLLIRTAGEDD